MHHKRRRHRAARAGCNLCKPWKKNGCHHERPGDARKLQERVPKPHEAERG